MSLITVITPMYNEEAVIAESYRRLKAVMEKTGEAYELIYVNDGSADRTMEIMAEFAAADEHICLIDFSRNFGHQAAVTAGLEHAKGDAVVIIDADLQDPPELIPQMIEKWREGYEVVYGKREERDGETAFKKLTAALYYRLLYWLCDGQIPRDTGDFRLMDRKAVDAVNNMPEKSRFMRGMVAWVGFKQYPLCYHREQRFAGETKYTMKKMLRLAVDGITAFSFKPLRLITLLGVVGAGLSGLALLALLVLLLCGRAPEKID